MKQDKLLIGILVGIVLLVAAALVTVLMRSPANETYRADNTPAGVVHNYFLAIQREDYEKAYSYLSDELESKPELDDFIRQVNDFYGTTEASLRIGESRGDPQHTTVELFITRYRVGNIFENSSYTTEETALLTSTSDGQWKLLDFPQPYWGWHWDQPER